MNRYILVFLAAIFAGFSGLISPSPHRDCWADPPSGSKKSEPRVRGADFVRLRRDKTGTPLALETAIIRYEVGNEKRPDKRSPKSSFPKDVIVDLVGVVHVGEKEYYQRLNQEFEQYDALLYELVAAKGAEVPRKGQSRGAMHPIAALQHGLKSALQLEFQLDHIDYTPNNFIHADLSPQEFAASMKSRGESFWKLYFRMIGAGIAQQAKDPSGARTMRLNLALLGSNRSMQLRQSMAEQFEDITGMMRALEGKNGSTLVSERNKRALKVLEEQAAAGKRKIGIFYGAGHFPDIHRRLVEEFGMKPIGRTWLTAWNLEENAAP